MESNRLVRGFIAVFGIGLAACASDGKKACEDLSSAFGDTAQRCGYNAKQFHDIVYAAGQCDSATTLRDSTSFYNTCLPFIEQIACADLMSNMIALPAVCDGEIGH